MEPETAGDPMTGLKWTRKTTEKIARALQRHGISVGRSTVSRLLKQMDFRLRVNHKKRSTASPKERDRQFRVIRRRRNWFVRSGDPILSIDCKKKELIGNFKNTGAAWKQKATETLATDFRSDAYSGPQFLDHPLSWISADLNVGGGNEAEKSEAV